MSDTVFPAKLNHGRRAGYAQFRLQRSRFVIDAGMNDAAVVAALMPAYAVFFLQQQEAKARKSSSDFQRYGEADNPSANDNHVIR
jgi:hypothetical protein